MGEEKAARLLGEGREINVVDDIPVKYFPILKDAHMQHVFSI